MAFKLNPITGALDLVGITTAPPGTVATVQEFTLDSTDASNKFVTLTSTPSSAASTVLLVASAPSLAYGVDYTVSGNQVSWSTYALDGILAAGDILTVMYIV